MKFFKKYKLKIISIILILIIAICVPLFVLKSAKNHAMYNKPIPQTKTYTIWEVDTFEGGAKSRINYLKNIARDMEKANPGLLFITKQIEPSKLEVQLKNSMPDMISFGYGVGNMLKDFLTKLDINAKYNNNFFTCGNIATSTYAIPYMASGYAMFTHGTAYDKFYCGTDGYAKPNLIYSNMDLSPILQQSTYQAYKEFIYDTKSCLLGTARDVYRITNLNNIGRLNASISPIDTYSDLVQYLGVINADKITNQFANYCISVKYQAKLVDYGLFSPLDNNIYTSGIYKDMEIAIKNCKIANVFE